MKTALPQHHQQIAQEIRELIRLLDSSHWSSQLEQLKERLDQVSTQMRDALKHLELPSSADARQRMRDAFHSWELPSSTEAQQRMCDALHSLSHHVDSLRGQMEEKATSVKQHWRSARTQMAQAYENLAASLAQANIHVPHLRPTNYTRSLFHMTSGVTALLMIQHSFAMPVLAWIMGVLFVTAWCLELFRRFFPKLNDVLMRHMGILAHPHEHHRVSSGTWYIVALFLLSLTVTPLMGSLAVIILGFCDPAAAFVGRRWGRVQIYAGRTLEGTLTFVATGIAISLAVIWIYYAGVFPFWKMFAVAATASTAGALAELFSKRIDDNLSIPLATGWSAWLILFLLP